MKKLVLLFLVVLLLASSFFVLPIQAATQGFSDVKEDYWAYEAINYLSGKGILTGVGGGLFKPDDPVTREQLAKIICIAKGISEYKPAKPTFKDVSPSSWSYGYVEAAVKSGYVKGFSDGTFRPKDNIKRADLAVLLVRVMGKEVEAQKYTEPLTFSNDEASIPKYAVGAMSLAYNNHYQLLNYREGRNVKPNESATRAEVAYAVFRVLKPVKVGGTVNLASGSEADSLFLPLATIGASGDYWLLQFTNLIGLDENENVYPLAAKEVPTVQNGLVQLYEVNGEKRMKVTYHLRGGLKWSDGTPVTVNDYIFTEKLLADPKVKVVSASSMWANFIDHVEAPNSSTLVYYYKVVDPQYILGRGVLPAHILKPIYDKDPSLINTCDFNTKPVGNGPFMLESWVKNSYISFVRNPYYPWGQPLVDRIVIKYIPDSNTRLANLMAGTILASSIDPQQVSVLKNSNKFNVYVSFSEGGLTYIGCNTANPLLSDKRVRQAIAYGINMEGYGKQYYGFDVPRATGPIMKSSWAYNPNAKKYYYDINKAKALLAEAGFKMGPNGVLVSSDGKEFVVTLGTTTATSAKQIGVFIQSELQKLGIKVNLASYPISTYYGRVIPQGQVDLYFAGWIEDPLFPGKLDSYKCDQIPTPENNYSGLNWSRWCNKDATNYANLAYSTLDRELAKKYYWKFQEIYTEELPEIPWLERVGISAIRKEFKNYIGSKGGINRFTWNASFWYLDN
ncbi:MULTISPECIES: ABC transporter substrate-binding protein [Caldisericum]|uniref:SLH domain-containing protein n=1 Tax=Caldisericum exile TaxID=693075 RepID=A0A2J6WER6_9BACT|nr:MAG: hypothetical protein C0189_02520 [Caldisericum exile]